MYMGRPPYTEQLNDISFWYPILKRIGMRTPDTKLFYADESIGKILDGEATPEFTQLAETIAAATQSFGGEAFLRTGLTSNKHDWEDTCHLTTGSITGHHLGRLIEFSMMVDLPYTTFAVRRMIPTAALTVAFKNMPIAREVRIFVEAGKVICAHPYWPTEAFDDQDDVTADQLEALQQLPAMDELTTMAEYTSRHFKGAWSVDFLEDTDGNWWLTDMALAATSYHWPGCEHGQISQEAV